MKRSEGRKAGQSGDFDVSYFGRTVTPSRMSDQSGRLFLFVVVVVAFFFFFDRYSARRQNPEILEKIYTALKKNPKLNE